MNEFLDRVAEVGPDLAVRATGLFVLACGLSLALIKGSAAQRHLVWGAALAGSLALPIIYFSAPKWRVLPTQAAERIEATASPEGEKPVGWKDFSAIGAVPSESPSAELPASPADSPTHAKEAGFIRTMSIGHILAAVWLAGVLCGCGRLVLGFARLRKFARQADPATGRVASLLKELARATGIRRPVQGLVSRESISPMTWGWSRPVVMLPVEAKSWPVERLRVVLLHELAHVRRWDFATQLVSELARSIYWFHPLSWWGVRCLRVEQEAACDDCVLAAGATADDYAEELLAVMVRLSHGFRGAGVALAMGRAERIEARLRSILANDSNRNPAGAWRLAMVTSLFATLATVTAVIGPVVAQEKPASPPAKQNATPPANASGDTNAITELTPEAAKDGAATPSAESVERLKGIGAGRQQITPTREDVSLVLRALQDRDLTISSHACLAVEKMAPMKLFQPEDMQAMWEGLRTKLRSQHDDTSEWSARGVAALAQHTELLAGETLSEAFDETMLMVSGSDPEMRRRGAVVSSRLVRLLPKDNLETLVRALLADDADGSSSRMATVALGSAAPKIETQALADDVAARLLALTKNTPAPDFVEVVAWKGLAHLAGATSNETREQIVGAILAAVADGRWKYMVTSGVYFPPKHAGAEALAVLASFLTLEELERAEKAIPPQAAGEKKEAYDSMYAAAKKALAARKLVVEHKAQPAVREEEDVAFFEKKYQTKITGVKPKGEYSDPDQFYSAIGKQLGIPEIAWQAAADKFGWKKDDGRHTFTILKGGPTAGGGHGTWDVLFIRSTINPETKKPDPATMEQVMVQIDYDGNITFPKIPKGNQ